MTRWGRVVAFLEFLPITSGMHAGKKLKLRPWQKEIVKAIYKTDKSGKRIVRQALVTLPRKNGKTALAAGLALAHLCGPEAEQRGQVFSAASDRDQAAIIYREMTAIIQEVPEFSERIIVRDFNKQLEDAVTGSTYQAMSSDARKAHGLSPSFVVYDELAQAPNRNLYDNLATGTGARSEPLMVVISTQSSDPNHVLSELTEYGRQVNGGVVDDPSFHATIYEADPDADPWDEKVWYDCNPALGDFRSLEEMRNFAVQAMRIPAKEASFRNLYLNQAVDAEQRFISSEDWDACGASVDLAKLRGRPCWGGLDLSSTTDLTSLVLYFPEDGGAVLPFFWVPGDDMLEKEAKDRVPYTAWQRQGFLETFPGRTIDKLAVAFKLAELAAEYDIQGIAYDRWRIEDLKKILSDEGIDLPLHPWGQGFRDMGPAVDAMETAILNCDLRHGGNPVLTWNCANTVIQVDPAGARKISKDKSFTRVDGMVSLCMAIGLHSREPKPVEIDFERSIFLAV
jgi:phage terminase large subunit-like protein